MSKTTYLKLSEQASMFYCPVSRMKVTKTSPAKLEGKYSKKIKNAINSGHLIKIKGGEYDDLMEDYDAAIKKARKLAAERANNKSAKTRQVNDNLAGRSGDDEEDEKPLSKQTREELIETLEDLEDITDGKVEEISEGLKKEIREFIENYDSETDSGVETEDDDDEDDEDDDK